MLDWYRAGEDVDRLIAKAKYAKAAKLLRGMLAVNSRDTHVRKKLAEVLAVDGRPQEAARILEEMVDELADDGFFTKAIAVVKKIQRIDPERGDLDHKLAGIAQRRENARKAFETVRLIKPDLSTLSPPDELAAVFRSPLFADASASELRAFIQGLDLLSFQPGEIVVAEGEPGSSLLVLASGRVRVFVRNDVGHQVQVRTLEPGDFFGEISILTEGPPTSDIVAESVLHCLVIPRPDVERFLLERPRVMLRMLRAEANRLRGMLEWQS